MQEATPKADAPLENPIDLYVSVTTTLLPLYRMHLGYDLMSEEDT